VAISNGSIIRSTWSCIRNSITPHFGNFSTSKLKKWSALGSLLLSFFFPTYPDVGGPWTHLKAAKGSYSLLPDLRPPTPSFPTRNVLQYDYCRRRCWPLCGYRFLFSFLAGATMGCLVCLDRKPRYCNGFNELLTSWGMLLFISPWRVEKHLLIRGILDCLFWPKHTLDYYRLNALLPQVEATT